MKKEILTLDAIKKDLLFVAEEQMLNKEKWRSSYFVPIIFLAIWAGVYFKSIFVGLLIFSTTIYQIVHYIIEYKEYRSNKKEILSLIDRAEISISNKTFSHIANEIIYEPRIVGRHRKSTKTIRVYYFDGGASWRVPNVAEHYSWSKEFYISSKGLENISIKGDEFYFVSLQAYHDIAYIYPCKNFELDKSLEK